MTLGMFMAVLDIQIVVTSLPEISEALSIAPDRMSWVQTAYLIAEVIAIPLTGLLTRVLSLRWLFVGALCLFTVASAACAASGGFETLIVARVVQGFAGGVADPVGVLGRLPAVSLPPAGRGDDAGRRHGRAGADGRPAGRRLDHPDLVLALAVPGQRPAWHRRRRRRRVASCRARPVSTRMPARSTWPASS